MKFDKITAVFSSLCLATALFIMALTPPSTGYEISIYDVYPWYLWLFICASVTSCVVSLVHRSFKHEVDSNWWIISTAIIIAANLVVTLLPVIRGYFLSNGGDTVDHLGYIRDIVLTNHFNSQNIYPLSHILTASVSFMTGLNPISVINIIPSIFYVLYIIGLYLLAKVLPWNPTFRLLVIALGSVQLFFNYSVSFLPFHLVLLLLPIILWLHQKTMVSQYKFAYAFVFILTLVASPFLHPLEALFLAGLFFVYAASIIIFRILTRTKRREKTDTLYPLGVSMVSALIVLVVLLLWFSRFPLFDRVLRTIYELFVYGFGGNSPLSEMLGEIQTVGFTILNFFDLLIKNFGHLLIYSFLSLTAIIIIIRKLFNQRSDLRVEEVFFSLMFIMFAALYMAIVVGIFPGTGRSLRIFNHALVAAIILSGIVFFESITQLKGMKLKIGVSTLTIAIIFSVVIGVFTVYPSPYMMSANTQVTRAQWVALEWFYSYKNSSATVYLEETTRRAPVAIYGSIFFSSHPVGSFWLGDRHFGYETVETLGLLYPQGTYIVISARNRAIYTILFPDIGWYTINDFDKLKLDPALNKVYYDGDVEIWRIFPSD